MSIDNNAKPKNRALKSRLALGALALLGVGAVLTAASWSTSAKFTQEATSGDLSFEVSVDGGATWAEAESGVFEIPVNLTGLEEAETRTSDTILLRNGGSDRQLVITGAEVTGSGVLFEGATPATASFGTASVASIGTPGSFSLLEPLPGGIEGGVLPVADGPAPTGIGYDVSVVTPTDWPTSYANGTGEVTVTITVANIEGMG